MNQQQAGMPGFPQAMGMPMGMPMGVPMGVPMGFPMGFPMVGMGMPMGMPMMGATTTMMGGSAGGMQGSMMNGANFMSGASIYNNPMLASTTMAGGSGQPVETPLTKKEALVKDLEAAETELANNKSRASDHGANDGTTNGGSSASTKAPATAERAADEESDEAPLRCHLHKKPNAKCKFCQREQNQGSGAAKKSEGSGAAKKAEAQQGAKSEGAGPAKNEDIEDYSRREFKCSPMLKDQIFSSSYFKSLLTINTIEDLTEEIAQYADTLDVYNVGSTTVPSCFICQVYRLFTLPHAEDLGELHAVTDHQGSAIVRCVGFLYMRFVVAPNHLWGKLEEYLFDDMELIYMSGAKQVTTTIGEYVESLLVRDKYFSTPLPRIPVKVRQMLEKELAPLPQYRKRMEANRRTFKNTRVSDLPVEVCIQGRWVDGLAKELVGRPSTARKVRVRLEDGSDVNVHLGKVVLRDTADGKGVKRSASESGSEGGDGGEKKGRSRRSRSRSRRRTGSPDWSRFKGRPDSEMVEELRERAKEDAVIGQGRVYSKRPLRDDVILATKVERGSHEARLLEEDRASSVSGSWTRKRVDTEESVESEAARRRRREEEDENAKKLRDIYEKYGATQKATTYSASSAQSRQKDVDEPEVLRLG